LPQPHGVLSREIQSITWDAARGVFPDWFKSQPKNIAAVEQLIWVASIFVVAPDCQLIYFENKVANVQYPAQLASNITPTNTKPV
jgi:hypothetical protein